MLLVKLTISNYKLDKTISNYKLGKAWVQCSVVLDQSR